jgi:hypothetical protein
VTFLGERSFNTPPLVEAADTPPFFHNNGADTIEEAVAFYTTDLFNDSPTGDGRAFVLSTDDINAIGGLLRAINALENIRQTSELAEAAKRQNGNRQRETLAQAVAETGDAIEVLTGGPIPLFAGTDTVALLVQAQTLQRQAMTRPPRNREPLLSQAQEILALARSRMVQ